MAITRTFDDIVADALSRIGVAEAGQDLAPENIEIGRKRLEAVLADFAGRGIIYAPDPDAIPLDLSQWISAALALQLLSDFPTDATALPDLPTIETMLRRLRPQLYVSRPLRAVYF